jgi:uncharacterized protein
MRNHQLTASKEFTVKKPLIAIAAAAALAALAPAADAASFSCYGHLTYTERTICDNPHLSALDSTMSRYYFNYMRTASRKDRREMRATQIGWLASRNSCSANLACLTTMYHNHIDDFKFGDY